jgi:Rgg/GadR/MutR family transcriptional activator
MNPLLGKTFKKLRKSKSVESKGIPALLISYSQLMRFENGENDISADKFFRLLREINLTAEEFELSYLTIQGDAEFSIISKLFSVTMDKKSSELRHLLEKTEKSIERNPKNQRLKLDGIVIKALLQQLGEEADLKGTEIAYLARFLVSVNEWSRYEVFLFGNCVDLFTIEQLKVLTEKILYPKTQNISSDYLQSNLNFSLLNIVSRYITIEYFSSIHEIFSYLEKHIDARSNMLERALFVYSKKLLAYRQEPTEQNYEAVKECISAFKTFECFYIAEKAEIELQNFRNSQKCEYSTLSKKDLS